MYEEIVKLEDPKIKSFVAKYTRNARYLTTINLILGTLTSIYFWAYPILSGRNLPFNLYIPGLNTLDSPTFEILYVIEVRQNRSF